MASSGLVLNPAEPPVTFHGRMPPVEAIQIYLATLGSNNSMIPMRVLTSDTIASVKMRIQSYKGFYTNQQRLVYRGRELTQDDCFVKDYGLCNGEILHLVLRLSDLVDVTVKTADGKQFFKVERTRNVRDLKHRIPFTKDGGSLYLDHHNQQQQQQLVLCGKNSEDKARFIDDICIQDDAVVHLLVRRKTAKVRSRALRKGVELSVDVDEVEAVEEEEHVSEILPYSASKFLSLVSSDINLEGSHVLEPASGVLRYEVPDVLADLLAQARAGLHSGHSPMLSSEGSGGAYFMKCEYGQENVAIFKPVDEEPLAVNNPRGFCDASKGEGLKRGTRIGEGAVREVAAYILDHPAEGQRMTSGKNLQGFAGVPPTMMVRCFHKAFHYSGDKNWNFTRKPKLGSFQQFVAAFSNCEDMGPANFPVEEVHKIAVLDMRLANTDRNGSNILACRGTNNSIKLVPIDHGYCLPEKFEDCTFEWLYWPQAHVPFDASTLKYIASLDADQDIALLKEHGWSLRSTCARVFRISTMLLKKGAAAGLTPVAVGSMMCRKSFDKKSQIELMLEEAEEKMLPASNEQFFMTALAKVMDSYIKNAK
jgi:hypothetical protein